MKELHYIKIGATTYKLGDFSSIEKEKLAGIEPNAQVNVIEKILVNGKETTAKGKTVNLQGLQLLLSAGRGITIDSNNTISCTLDTKVFVTAQTLPENPTEDEKGKIFLIPNKDGSSENRFLEYMWVEDEETKVGTWEIVGNFNADVDLSEYVKNSDLDARLGGYYKKEETYSSQQVDGKFANVEKKDKEQDKELQRLSEADTTMGGRVQTLETTTEAQGKSIKTLTDTTLKKGKQDLTPEEQKQVQSNIGTLSKDEIDRKNKEQDEKIATKVSAKTVAPTTPTPEFPYVRYNEQVLDEAQKKQVRDNIGAIDNKQLADGLGGKVEKEEGKGLSTNDYTNEEKQKVANSVMFTPQVLTPEQQEQVEKNIADGGYMRNLIESMGGKYNENNTWTLNNEILTYKEIVDSLVMTCDYRIIPAFNYSFYFQYSKIVTNFFKQAVEGRVVNLPSTIDMASNCRFMFSNCVKMRCIKLCDESDVRYGFILKACDNMFRNCISLKRIIGNIVINFATDVYNMFYGCGVLERVLITGLKKDISFSDSPNLSYDSINYMVTRRAGENQITITLHATPFALLNGTATEDQYTQSGHTKQEWTELNTLATTTKNIIFKAA